MMIRVIHHHIFISLLVLIIIGARSVSLELFLLRGKAKDDTVSSLDDHRDIDHPDLVEYSH
jgi:hypothetical protein